MNRSLRAQLGEIRDHLFPRLNCAHKRRYSESGVRHVLERRQPEASAPLYAYRCPHCAGWHLTRRAQFGVADFQNLDAQ